MSLNSLGYKLGKSPIAQSFFIDDAKGIFATKIQLYFKRRFNATADLQLPINIHIRPMRNGMPSDVEIIPGSTVYVDYNFVNTSTDGTAATDFVFDEPIYLNGLTDYAIVVYAETPEYEIFIAEIDETVVGSASARVNLNPNTGSIFYSQNGATFTPNQKQDLKFNLARARFNTGTGTVKLKNASVPRQLLNNNVLRTFAGDSDVRVHTINHGLQVNDTVSISGAAAVGGFTTGQLNGDHTITKIDAGGYEFKITGDVADSDAFGGGDEITATKNIPYSLVWPNMAMMKPNNTAISAKYKGTSGKSFAGVETPYNVDADFTAINLNKNNIALDRNYVIAADSIADAEIAIGASTAEMELTIGSTDNFVSPVIDLQRSSLTLIDNVIDKQDSAATSGFNVPMNFVSETTPSGGSTAAKHITTVTTLAQSAVGLKVLLSANRPKAAGIDLYYRVSSESELINTKNWVKIDPETNNPSDENTAVFREYEYLIGGKGGQLKSFIKFQLKIVMTSTNSAKVPVIKDLRTIALSV